MFTLQKWDYEWNFLPSAGDKVYGMNDSGWDTFAGTPFKSLAREICQNSLDARKNIAAPVIVEFHSFDIDQYRVPQIAELQDALKKAKKFWTIQHNDFATEDFLNLALSVAESPKIHCLRISDKNTTGLNGSNLRYGSPWCNLLKGQGVSDKSGTSGGSKGIGKYAPYACSALRTVFYSTVAEDGLQASQGVSRLISFLNDDNKLSMGLAYYGQGDEGCSPIPEYRSLDSSFDRTDADFGTDIFIIGFIDDADWKEKMIGSVLDGFLYAIEQKSLIVNIDGKVIDKNHLGKVIEQLDKKYMPEHADEYFQVLTNPQSQVFEDHEIKNAQGEVLGKVKLRALLNADFNRTCAMVRQTGMKIMDMNRISTFIYFAAVLYIEGDKLNAFLRKLENAQHTEWQVERLHTNKEQKEAKNLIKEIKDYVQQSIRSMRSESENKPINLSIGEYLSADTPDDKAKGKGEDVNNDVSSVSITTITRAGKDSSGDSGDENEDIAIDDPNGDMTPAEGESPDHHGQKKINPDVDPKPGDGNEGYKSADSKTPDDKRKKIISVPSSKTRVLCKNRKSGEYALIFTPTQDCDEAFIDVYMAAESQDYQADLVSATDSKGNSLEVKGGKIDGLAFKANEEIRLSIKINYSEMCAMEVKGFGNKK